MLMGVRKWHCQTGLACSLRWRLVREREKLAFELNRGISPNHALAGYRFEVCARRTDRDEILVEIEGCDKRLAVVHLTWRNESDPQWPTNRFFRTWEDFARDEMMPAHQELEAMS